MIIAMDKYVKKILEANVYEVAIQTPLEQAAGLSQRLGAEVLLKREDMQPVFSFKIRGAYNRIRSLDEKQRAKGVITASAGNHAQGVALAASRLGCDAHIVMGENTPTIKINAVRAFGGHVILHGDSYDDAALHAKDLAEKKGYTYVHPFDDEEVIAGQGTIGMEILRQHDGSLDAIYVPVGGGGLIGGIGAYVKYLRPETKIIGVECEGSAGMTAALAAGRRVILKSEDLDQFADGTAVRQVGKETFRLAKRVVDEVITVSIDEICAAIKDIFEDTRTIAEPSGALAVAGLKNHLSKGQSAVAIVTGANVNFDRLRHISERTEVGEQREILLGVSIPERPGSFRRFCSTIGKRSITEFNYRYVREDSAHVLVGIQTRPGEDRTRVIEKLSQQYEVVDLSGNEVAVLHVRHMVGGVAHIDDEKLFRFEFPEKPGALLRFLTVLGNRFNISMFHYRNHGSAFGRVLVGIQVPDREMKAFLKQLANINYRFWNETDNPAYRQFLLG
ncbi:MAG: threonine ammonia-lyase, biosynthetic [Gammaproteobacteria bacterium]|nr:threonine ammonia-lyase, biosynthetic [Gammaproteobacteria bacterium]MBT4494072.1 threonine ammonia-lyase, biosynthetic [Gammaproteobacteria bacterium]MBT7371592.1 threonine ammonia-lyase, biosynthetic [Gammaproteobacteria bacterium]